MKKFIIFIIIIIINCRKLTEEERNFGWRNYKVIRSNEDISKYNNLDVDGFIKIDKDLEDCYTRCKYIRDYDNWGEIYFEDYDNYDDCCEYCEFHYGTPKINKADLIKSIEYIIPMYDGYPTNNPCDVKWDVNYYDFFKDIVEFLLDYEITTFNNETCEIKN